jgi:hypothetical protein
LTNSTNLTGQMWADFEKKKTEKEKVVEGISWYTKKYGVAPKLIHISLESDLDVKLPEFEGMTIHRVRNIMPNNYWLVVPDGIGIVPPKNTLDLEKWKDADKPKKKKKRGRPKKK